MPAIFRKRAKTGKIYENLGENVQNLKIIWKRAGDCVHYCMQQTARKGPGFPYSAHFVFHNKRYQVLYSFDISEKSSDSMTNKIDNS